MEESIMSFYNAPITNQVPNGVVSIIQLHAYVSTNEWLRERTDRTRVALDDEKRFRQLKQSLLPYVTPAGVFSYRKEDRLLFPSGELVIDIDHLASPEEACTWRDTLFADERLRPDLAFISPSNDIREMAANIIGKDDFLEVYVSTPIEECERRDVKGLYAKARRGEIKNFTGISAPFEAPAQPALVLDTSALSLEESVNKLLELILPRIQKK